MNREKQTERVCGLWITATLRFGDMQPGDYCLKRPGYELDFERIIEHAKELGRFFELNSSPDRLDVPVENARLVGAAGIRIAILDGLALSYC
jgi:DNA polymerase (family 10)